MTGRPASARRVDGLAIRRRRAIGAAGIVMWMAACSGSSPDDSGQSSTPIVTAAQATAPPSTTPATTTSESASPSTTTQADDSSTASAADTEQTGEQADTGASPIEADRPRQVTSPGTYASDLLPLAIDLELADEIRTTRAFDGLIEFGSPDGPDDSRWVGLFSVDTMVVAEVDGATTGLVPASADLTAWADAIGHSDVRTGSGSIGGISASWWDLETAPGCESCFWPLFETTGRSLWGTLAGVTQRIWAVDAPGSTILVAVEAPTADFDDWLATVGTNVFDGLRFGEPTGHSRARPRGEEFGPHAVGRASTVAVDATRPTVAVADDRGDIVPASNERRLVIDVSYPSTDGGFGGAPIEGELPLVVVAPAVRDFGFSLPTNRALATHGYIVATIRFPESSYPGLLISGIPHQPADVSFVIDHLLDGGLPDDLAVHVDPERIGVVGWSGGATTAFGLLRSECCVDDRIDAFVAHAGTPYDFESQSLASGVPILHIGSLGDEVVPSAGLIDFHRDLDAPSSLAMFEFDGHLGWLTPGAHGYLDAFSLTKAFLDLHVRGDTDIDLEQIADAGDFVQVEFP